MSRRRKVWAKFSSSDRLTQLHDQTVAEPNLDTWDLRVSKEVLFRVVHSFAVTLSIQFFARPDVTVTIDQAAVVKCHFIPVKVGAGRGRQGPDNLAPKSTAIGGMRVSRANQHNIFVPDWFRLSAMRSPATAVRDLNLQMDRLRRSR